MSTTVITDFTERRVLRGDLTEMIAWMQEAYRDRQANADKADDIEGANFYQAEAYAYHDILTHLTARQCERCGVHEGDDTVVADALARCSVQPDGKHVWDFPDEDPEVAALTPDQRKRYDALTEGGVDHDLSLRDARKW